jgi:hypothetical protein
MVSRGWEQNGPGSVEADLQEFQWPQGTGPKAESASAPDPL